MVLEWKGGDKTGTLVMECYDIKPNVSRANNADEMVNTVLGELRESTNQITKYKCVSVVTF